MIPPPTGLGASQKGSHGTRATTQRRRASNVIIDTQHAPRDIHAHKLLPYHRTAPPPQPPPPLVVKPSIATTNAAGQVHWRGAPSIHAPPTRSTRPLLILPSPEAQAWLPRQLYALHHRFKPTRQLASAQSAEHWETSSSPSTHTHDSPPLLPPSLPPHLNLARHKGKQEQQWRPAPTRAHAGSSAWGSWD
jgi:hypothetical protein